MRSKRSAPTASPGIAALRGDDVWFLHRHGRARPEGGAGRRGRRRDARRPSWTGSPAGSRRRGTGCRFRATSSSARPSPAHQAGVQELIERIFERNPDDFYERSYSGLYCVGCEAFKQPSEIVDGKCELHPTRTLEMVSERNWFFRLSRYQRFPAAAHRASPGIHPAGEPAERDPRTPRRRGSRMCRRAAHGSAGACRSPGRRATGEQQTTYVWFDALPNYWTATRLRGLRARLAGAAARHRQGHHAGSTASSGPRCSRRQASPLPGARLGPRVRAAGWRTVQQERRRASSTSTRRSTASGPTPSATSCCGKFPGMATATSAGNGSRSGTLSDLADGIGNLASRSLAMIVQVPRRRGARRPPSPDTPLDAKGAELVEQYAAAHGPAGPAARR